MRSKLAGLAALAALMSLASAATGPLPPHYEVMQVNGTPVRVGYVVAPSTNYALEVRLAAGAAGVRDVLRTFLSEPKDECAQNGGFLSELTGQPLGTLIQDGRVLHLGSDGWRLELDSKGHPTIVPDELHVAGTVVNAKGNPRTWTAFQINEPPTPNRDTAVVFTDDWNGPIKSRLDTAVIVKAGKVTGVLKAARNTDIPSNGFVIAFGGKYAANANLFNVGDTVKYLVVDRKGKSPTATSAVAGGPPLVLAGKKPSSATFNDTHLVNGRATRSAIGFTAKRDVIQAIFPSATLPEVTQVMLRLGAVTALNLDGGGSAGLECRSGTVAPVGRRLPSALVVVRR
ncbi:MAG TPA: phosphodiester glycosidase family protein [Deinococcales bacterium]|nr:phosphodiester glycosidase family protein [Deinococcales bacterium]